MGVPKILRFKGKYNISSLTLGVGYFNTRKSYYNTSIGNERFCINF